MPPIGMLRQVMGDNFFYILYFQEPGVAEADLGARPGHDDAPDAVRRIDRRRRGRPGRGHGPHVRPRPDGASSSGWPEPDGLPDWLSQEELDHYIAEFTRTGFTGGVNWYRNLDRNWETDASTSPRPRSRCRRCSSAAPTTRCSS